MYYLKARLDSERKEQIFKAYVTEGIRMISQHTAEGLPLENSEYIGTSYLDMLKPTKFSNETASEIIDRISNGLERLNDGFI